MNVNKIEVMPNDEAQERQEQAARKCKPANESNTRKRACKKKCKGCMVQEHDR